MSDAGQKTLEIVSVEDDAPARQINHVQLGRLATALKSQFENFQSDRRLTEEKWIRGLRQYLGIYDPDIQEKLSTSRSRAYPRVTRVKCISVLARIMNLMFPGNEKNWTLSASPSPEMPEEEIRAILSQKLEKMREEDPQARLDEATANAALQEVADVRAAALAKEIEDQLAEIGGQNTNYVALNRKVADSGIKYGIGVLLGPYVKETIETSWVLIDGTPRPRPKTRYKPQFEFLPVWDFYPDMSCTSLDEMDGYYVRKVLSKPQLRKLARRSDFFDDQIKKFIKDNAEGNYTAQNFETQLRQLGTKAETANPYAADKVSGNKYEVIIWRGPVDAKALREAGVDVPEDHAADDVEAEIWMLGTSVIKADLSPWYKLGVDMRTAHVFEFDEDDTSPIANGLPYIVRDSQMSIAAATRMMLDNASIVCGPNVEVNTDLLAHGSDTTIEAYKVWERTGMGAEAAVPAVRNVTIDSHIDELMKMIDMFMRFADIETFVGPATGGDMERAPSEPMRTAAGASMIRGDAALPFKDIVRNFDNFTQSVIYSLVVFNQKFNPGLVPQGDYNVVPRGATSLIAKEIRGMQLDQLATTLSEEERVYIDEEKLVRARFAVRDVDDILAPAGEVRERLAARAKQAAEAKQQQDEMVRAELRKTLSEAFKDISQAQKNSANADATTVKSAMQVIEEGLKDDVNDAPPRRDRINHQNVERS